MVKKLPKYTKVEQALIDKVTAQGYSTFEDLINLQEHRLEQFYKPAPTIPSGKIPTGKLTWREFVPLTKEEYKSLTKEDKDRLGYWFEQWTQPVASYSTKENAPAQFVFFGIIADKLGIDRADFNWTKFRRRYFKVNPDRYAEFKASRKGRKKK